MRTLRSPTSSGAPTLACVALAAAAALQPLAAQSADRPEPGAELRVWLVTAGPGDAVWERYGHNALRVLDTGTGRDVSYNWGIFDFDQVDFIPRFLQGRMLYMMAPFPTGAMIDAYRGANREVVLQELDLTAGEKAELRDFAERNALPQNRDYVYQYFLDNCSTRVRDLLDHVLGGRLRSAFADEPTGTSYRTHTRRLTQVDPLVFAGMDMLLGSPTDRPISVWEEMFLPLTLRDEIRGLRITGDDGSTRPLVSTERTVVTASRPPAPAAPPRWFGFYLLIGSLTGALFASMASVRVRSSPVLRRSIVTLGVAWSLAGGVAGTILVLLLFTDHTFAYWNENLFLANPLLLGIAVTLPFSSDGSALGPLGRRLAMIVAGVALLGLALQAAPFSVHRNGIFFALLLPGHLGLAWGMARRERPSRERSAAGG